MKILLAFLVCSLVLCSDTAIAQNSLEDVLVKVYIPSSDEEKVIALKPNQKASVFVYLSSLGDPLDKFMVSIVSNTDNKLLANTLSGSDGEVVFRKIPAGNYTVYVNRRVVRDDEMSTVKVGDVRLRAYP
jgi:hypothetical protein